MIIDVLSVIVGLVVLVIASDKFVDGAAAAASRLRIDPLIIGLVILGFGTSATEISVSIFAASSGKPELALGNAIGSNIANISLVLGVTAIIAKIKIKSPTVLGELTILLVATVITGIILMDYELSRVDSILLAVILATVLTLMIYRGHRSRRDKFTVGVAHEVLRISLATAWVWTFLGLIFLLLSSKVLVWGASNIAQSMGISDLVIGLTIVAIGTSLPELAASITAAIKNEHDMAVGNVIGSNLFNLLAVIGISGLIEPFRLSHEAMQRDFLLMLALTIFLYVVSSNFGGRTINRWHGATVFIIFVSYLSTIYVQSVP